MGRRHPPRRRHLPATVAAGRRDRAPRQRGRRAVARLRIPGPASLARVEAAIAEWRWSWATERTGPQFRHLERGDRRARRQRRGARAGRQRGQPLVPRVPRVATTRRGDARGAARARVRTNAVGRAPGAASRCSPTTRHPWVSCAGSALGRPVPCSDRRAAATSRLHSTSEGALTRPLRARYRACAADLRRRRRGRWRRRLAVTPG